MPNSTRSSSGSAHCRPAETVARIDWRPSRWLAAALVALGVLAALSVLTSEMPRGLAWPTATAAGAWGLRAARRWLRRPAHAFVFRGDAAPVLVDGEPAHDVELHWRGPLAFLAWHDGQGRRQRLSWWPDTLPPARRRELRLAAPAPRAAPDGTSMAP